MPTDAIAEPDAMIEVRDLTHYYGPMPAVENVNFTVRRGEILGFLGPNGAGQDHHHAYSDRVYAAHTGNGDAGRV